MSAPTALKRLRGLAPRWRIIRAWRAKGAANHHCPDPLDLGAVELPEIVMERKKAVRLELYPTPLLMPLGAEQWASSA